MKKSRKASVISSMNSAGSMNPTLLNIKKKIKHFCIILQFNIFMHVAALCVAVTVL